MEIKFIEKEDIMEEIILDDIEHVNESLIELKRSILNLNDKDEDSEVYHRFCDMHRSIYHSIVLSLLEMCGMNKHPSL